MRSTLGLVAALALLSGVACEGPEPAQLGSNNPNNPERECRTSSSCDEFWVCTGEGVCEPGPCLDGEKSPGERGVDCGGGCEPCALGTSCLSGTDCESGACVAQVCAEPVPPNNNIQPTCEDPGDLERFVLWENGISAEISYIANTRGADPVLASGTAIADFDGDGDVDVIVTNVGGSPTLFTNDGAGGFTAATSSGLETLTLTTSLSVADFDGDGDADVVMGRTSGLYVLINQGDATFVDESATRGLGETTDVVSSGSFADFDADGDLDFYLGSYVPPFEVMASFMLPAPLPNRLYRNDGLGFFTEMSYSPGGIGEEGSTLAVAWWDFNADGRPDLWASNDFGMIQQPSQLWLNGGPDPADLDGWLWQDISASARVDVGIFGMSASLADFDNDGDQDGYASNMAQNVLHVVNGSSTTNEAVQRGVDCSVLVDPRPTPVNPPAYVARLDGMQPFLDQYTDSESPYYSLTSWAATFFDFDHDGWLDLHVVNGTTLSDLTPEASFQPNYLFVNDGAGSFDQSPCWTLPDIRGTSRGAAAGDLDGDGDMDIVWADQGDNGDGAVYAIRNEMAAGNWLIVELDGRAPNTDAIGAKVTVQAGGATQTRWIDGGQSFMSVSERVAHFGLGAVDTIDSLTVDWPDGTTQVVPVAAVNARIGVVQQ